MVWTKRCAIRLTSARSRAPVGETGTARQNCARPLIEGLKRAEYVNHVGAYDFMAGRTECGNKVRILNILDEYTRECLMMLVAPSTAAKQVIRALDWLFLARGGPADLRSDNGPEFIAYAMQD